MTSNDYFTGASGTRYDYPAIAARIRKEAPHTIGEHISVQLAAIGLLEEMRDGTTPCGLPYTFVATAKHTEAPWKDNGTGLIYGRCSGDDDEAPLVADVCNVAGNYTEQEQANARLIAAAPAQALILDLVQRGLMTLGEGEAEFEGVMYWFDHRQPDWCVGVLDAIGWDAASDAIAN